MAEVIDIQTFAWDFSEPKKKILWHLKVMGEAGLQDLARKLKISKMAVHKHLVTLEDKGLVESTRLRLGVGRPKLIYRLSSASKNLFPRAYSAMAVCALQFIERKMGREAINEVLQERQRELFMKYYERLKGLEFDARVKELAKIRDEEGYMAEAKKLPSGGYLLFEHNCPIIEVAKSYWEACSTEKELFENLLEAKVETTHRAAKGDMVCRFVIKERKNLDTWSL